MANKENKRPTWDYIVYLVKKLLLELFTKMYVRCRINWICINKGRWDSYKIRKRIRNGVGFLWNQQGNKASVCIIFQFFIVNLKFCQKKASSNPQNAPPLLFPFLIQIQHTLISQPHGSYSLWSHKSWDIPL